MTEYETARGAKVFAAGTIDFAASLDDPAVAQLVENVWARLLEARSTCRSRGRSCGRGAPPSPCARGAAAAPSAARAAPPRAPRTRARGRRSPIRSISAHGPIGQFVPKRIARSRSSGRHARLVEDADAVVQQRDQDAVDDEARACRGSGSAPCRALPRTRRRRRRRSSSVSSVRTTSTSGSTGAGLKKCMPTTRSGRAVAAAISVTESAEVFVARIASGRGRRRARRTAPASASSSSTIASITRSQPGEVGEVGRESSAARARRPSPPRSAGPSRRRARGSGRSSAARARRARR